MTGYLEGGWILDGRDGAGKPVLIRIGDRELVESEEGVTLGRHPSLADHVIDDPSVSRRHLRLGMRDGGFTIEDLNSLNGTLIDGVDAPAFRLATLAEGTRIGLGKVELRLTRVAG